MLNATYLFLVKEVQEQGAPCSLHIQKNAKPKATCKEFVKWACTKRCVTQV